MYLEAGTMSGSTSGKGSAPADGKNGAAAAAAISRAILSNCHGNKLEQQPWSSLTIREPKPWSTTDLKQDLRSNLATSVLKLSRRKSMSRRRDRHIWLRSSGDRVIHSLSTIAADPLLVGCRVRDARSRSLSAMFNSSHSVSFASTRQRLEARTLRKACFHGRESWRWTLSCL